MVQATIGVVFSYGEERVFLQQYGRVLEAAGAVAAYLPYTSRSETIDRYLDLYEGLLLTGGEDIEPTRYGSEPGPLREASDPDRDAFELELLRRALDRDCPVLGVCRGIQALNVAAGGTLYQDIAAEVPRAMAHRPDPFWDRDRRLVSYGHDVLVEPSSLLATVLGCTRLSVNSYHHQAVRGPGEGVRVSAWAPDGVIEGIEIPARRFAVAVQWHPELLTGESREARALFDRFVRACQGRRARRLHGTRRARR